MYVNNASRAVGVCTSAGPTNWNLHLRREKLILITIKKQDRHNRVPRTCACYAWSVSLLTQSVAIDWELIRRRHPFGVLHLQWFWCCDFLRQYDSTDSILYDMVASRKVPCNSWSWRSGRVLKRLFKDANDLLDLAWKRSLPWSPWDVCHVPAK